MSAHDGFDPADRVGVPGQGTFRKGPFDQDWTDVHDPNRKIEGGPFGTYDNTFGVPNVTVEKPTESGWGLPPTQSKPSHEESWSPPAPSSLSSLGQFGVFVILGLAMLALLLAFFAMVAAYAIFAGLLGAIVWAIPYIIASRAARYVLARRWAHRTFAQKVGALLALPLFAVFLYVAMGIATAGAMDTIDSVSVRPFQMEEAIVAIGYGAFLAGVLVIVAKDLRGTLPGTRSRRPKAGNVVVTAATSPGATAKDADLAGGLPEVACIPGAFPMVRRGKVPLPRWWLAIGEDVRGPYEGPNADEVARQFAPAGLQEVHVMMDGGTGWALVPVRREAPHSA